MNKDMFDGQLSRSTLLLVKGILTASMKTPEAFEWTVQGLGMMRIYLAPELRLHVWDSALKVPAASPIHSHPWDLDSLIVAGIIRQVRFLTEEQHEKIYRCSIREGQGQIFSSATIQCGSNAHCVSEVQPLKLAEQPVEQYRSGSRYFQTKDEIHQSFPEDGTVTLVSRTFSEDKDHAMVCWRGAGSFVDAKPRPATPEEVRGVCERSLAAWF
jgi:hypothetical protein